MNMPPIAFLLGCERSGSTWLANILDAHEDVELLMEPFAPFASVFPGFPPRHEYVAEPSAPLQELVRRGLPSTLPMKYPLLYRPGRPVSWRSIDAMMVRSSHRALRGVRLTPPLFIQRWELLNLNQSEIPAGLRVRKNGAPSQTVVKELRLNLKVPVLRGAFPDARYVVIIRHPAAQLTSVRRWIEQGRLQELAAALKTFPADLERSPELQRYRAYLGDGSLDDVLVAWWFLNYETLLGDLHRLQAPALVIRHEELAANPAGGVGKLFSFLGLRASASVAKYVEHSSASEQRSSSPLDTFRRSAQHSRETISAADRSLVDKLERAARDLCRSEALRAYFPAPLDPSRE